MQKNIKELGLEIIELEDQVLLVDKKAYIGFGKWMVNTNMNNAVVRAANETLVNRGGCYKIIFSTEQLEGLPLLVIEDEDVFVFNTLSYQIKEFLHSISFRKGFRKAKETYKFTEERLRRAIQIAYSNGLNNNSYGKVMEDDIIQFISQKELYVEVEEVLQVRHGTNWYDLPNQKSGRDPEGINQTDIRLKITDNKIKAVWK